MNILFLHLGVGILSEIAKFTPFLLQERIGEKIAKGDTCLRPLSRIMKKMNEAVPGKDLPDQNHPPLRVQCILLQP